MPSIHGEWVGSLAGAAIAARKTSVALIIAAACSALALLEVASAGAAAGKPAETRVTIQTWPDGVFGHVKSPSAHRCAERRPVAIFSQRGSHRKPGKDKRIGTAAAKRSHGVYQWSEKTARSGRFYAKAARRKGCRPAFSRSVGSTEGALGDLGAGGPADPPSCSPYVSESVSSVCKFDQMHLRMFENTFNFCTFGDTNRSCDGNAESGLFPWGTDAFGGRPRVTFQWNHNNHSVLFFALRPGQSQGTAHLGGSVPSSGSPNFHVEDGFAQDDRGYPNGAHFYTPDLPGQAAGEPGGPLYLNFVNETFNDNAHIYIRGYLYLKR